LAGLKPEVAKVDLARKGTWYRLMAGPVKSSQAATELCRKLKRRRQFCEPSFMGTI
jgi:cell division protein FtsN